MDPFVVENPLLNLSSQYPDSVARAYPSRFVIVRPFMTKLVLGLEPACEFVQRKLLWLEVLG